MSKTWKVRIEAEVVARNFDSAQQKVADLEKRIKHADVHSSHVSMKGEKA